MSEVVTCGCCGRGVWDNEDENAHFGQQPYPDDAGFGMCKDCGGDKKAADFKKKLGWAATCFYEARFDVARNALNEANKAKWDGLSYERKVAFIIRCLEKGILAW